MLIVWISGPWKSQYLEKENVNNRWVQTARVIWGEDNIDAVARGEYYLQSEVSKDPQKQDAVDKATPYCFKASEKEIKESEQDKGVGSHLRSIMHGGRK